MIEQFCDYFSINNFIAQTINEMYILIIRTLINNYNKILTKTMQIVNYTFTGYPYIQNCTNIINNHNKLHFLKFLLYNNSSMKYPMESGFSAKTECHVVIVPCIFNPLQEKGGGYQIRLNFLCELSHNFLLGVNIKL